MTRRTIPVRAETPAPTELRVWRLRPADRCDACGAQAYVAAVVNDVELLFCAHHYGRHAEKLEEIATRITDERDKLKQH